MKIQQISQYQITPKNHYLCEKDSNMKLIHYLSFFLIALFTLSCGTKKAEKERIISVTIEPQRYFVEKIAGDLFEVNCVTPAGQSPETYDPTPQQMVQIGKSMAYFRIGEIGFERAWMKNLSLQNPDMKVFDLSKGMKMIENHEEHIHHDHEGHHHHHGLVDPHIWTSIQGAKTIAKNILDAVIELDPDNQSIYKEKYQALTDEITKTDETLKKLLEPLHGTSFIIYHPALTYFANEFGLHQLCIELDGKEPSPAQLKKLVDTANESKAKVVFIQKEFDQKNAELIAKETGCKLEQINPLDYNWPEAMIHLATILAK